MKCEHVSRGRYRSIFPKEAHRLGDGVVQRASNDTARRLFAIAAVMTAGGYSANRAFADTYGNIAGPNLSLSTSWTDETTSSAAVTPPGASDIAKFDASGAGGTFNLGAGTSWMGIAVASPTTSAVTIGTSGDSANTLTIGASGIDMTVATQNLTIVSGTTLGAAQTWNIASGRTLTQTGTLALNGSPLLIQGGGNISSGGVISGSGAITMSGTGTLSLTKADTNSSGITINSGTVSASVATAMGTGTVTFGGGTWALTGSSGTSYTNKISVPSGASGTISLTGSESIAPSTGNITGSGTLNLSIGSGAVLSSTGRLDFDAFAGTIELGSSTGTLHFAQSSNSLEDLHLANLDMGTSTALMNNTKSGPIDIGSLSGGSGTIIQGAASTNATTTLVIGGGSLTSTTFAGSIQNGTDGSSALTALTLNSGTLALTGSGNTYSGATTISGGTLQIGNGGSTGSIGTGVVTNNSVLTFDPGSSGNFATASAISGTGILNHTGAGTTILSGNNSYSGGTNISAGTLVANNTTSALGSGAVAVNGGTLAGVGTIGAAVTVNPTGQITAGANGVGTLSMASLTLNSGSVINTNFSATAPTNLINITTANGLTVNGGGIDLYAVGNSPLDTNGTYNIFQFPSAYTLPVPTNLLTVLNPPPSSTPTYTWGTNGNDITLTVSGLASASSWNLSGGGSWAVAGNWTAGIPNAAGSVATLSSSPGITTASTLTLDGSETVGNLVFNNSTAAYTVARGTGGSLIIDNSGIQAGITDLNGTHLISAPVVLNFTTLVSVVNASDSLGISGAISGNGGIIVSGSGTLVLSGSNTYLGATNISSGTLQVGAGGTTGSIPAGPISNNGVLAFNLSSPTTVSNVLSGTGSLVQEGSATLVVSGANTYTGSTNISGGILQIGTGGAIGTGSLIVATGAELDLNGTGVTATSLSGGGTIDNVTAGGTTTVTVGSGNNSTTFSGALKNTTGTVNLVKVGTGNLTLSGVNTYTGTTTIGTAGATSASAGTLTVTGSISNGGAFTVGDDANVTVSGTGSITASSFSFGSAENTVVSVTGGSVNVSGVLAAANTNGNNLGYLSLTGGNVTANSVTIGRTGSTNSTGIVTGGVSTSSGIYVNGGTLNITTTLGLGTSTASNSSVNMRVDSGSVIVGGTTDITNDQGSSPIRYSVLDLAGGTFTSNDTTGAGMLIAGGGYAAATGELLIRNNATLNATTITLGNSSQTGGAAVLEMLGGTINLGAGGIVFAGASVNPVINFGGTTYATAPTLAASAPWSSSLKMTLTDSNSGLSPVLQAANSSGGAENISLSGILAGSGGLNKTGAGTLTLSAADSFSGAMTVNAGVLTLTSTGSLVNSTAISTAAGATFNANGSTNDGLNTGTALVNSGTTNFGANTATGGTPTALTLGSLNIASGVVTVADPGAGNHANRWVLNTGALTIAGTTGAWTGKLDLASNDMIVSGVGSTGLATITSQATQGYNGGAWNGAGGIVSSTAAADTTHLHALGVILNDDGTKTGTALYPSGFDGISEGSPDSDVLIKYTYYGDTNLDGKVDGGDYSRIDNAVLANATSAGSATGWFNGDFNYDGVINGSDYTLIDNAFNTQGAQLSAEVASPTAQIAGSGATSAVPEPASLGLLALGAVAMLGRRGRRRTH